jgi:hypothetical protein
MTDLDPFTLKAHLGSHGAFIRFTGGEGGGWFADVSIDAGGGAQARVRLTFGGVAALRMGSEDDNREYRGPYVLEVIQDSEWLKNDLAAYVKKFGTRLLPAVAKDLQHFVLRGHDLTLGLLARHVSCARVDTNPA